MAYRVTLDGAAKGAKFETKEEAIEMLKVLIGKTLSEEELNQQIAQHIQEA